MVKAADAARAGFKYVGRSYEEMDCQAFVEKCLKDAGLDVDLKGSNTWYRKIRAEGWVGTPEECKAVFGYIPVGAFLFIREPSGSEPGKYRGDGIGDVSHMGIYTGSGLGALHSSYSNGCVCESKFKGKTIKRGGWNSVGLWKRLIYGDAIDQKLSGGGRKTVEVNYQAMVTGGKLRVRDEPTEESDWLCRIPDGTVITITEEADGWGKTEYAGQTGWVMLRFVQRLDGGQETDAPAADQETVDVTLTLTRREAELLLKIADSLEWKLTQITGGLG